MNKEDKKMLQELQKENAENIKKLENTFWHDYYETKNIFDLAKKILGKND